MKRDDDRGKAELGRPSTRFSNNVEVLLGTESAFPHLPAPVTVQGQSYFLVRGEAGYRLLSTVCPHKGGQVFDAGSCFECPSHGWRFDRQSGECVTSASARLHSSVVTVRGGELYAALPVPVGGRDRADSKKLPPDGLTVRLHAHACMELTYRGFSLLTDPWLDGPAFLGAWTQYPATTVDLAKLRPDAIFISHEHSDHFHEPTLAWFDRATPIYVPDFPNRRLIRRLGALGFSDVRAMRFGETHAVSGHIRMECYEPASLWNDAIALIDVDGFRILNVNDAGLNHRIAPLVAPVNVVASSFSPGASSYPLAWTHLSDARKDQLLERAQRGYLPMLRGALELYGAEYLLPIASHFALWHPAHRGYARKMRRNTVDDIVRAFADTSFHVIDILPGESWEGARGVVTRLWHRRDRLYDPANVMRYLQRRFDAQAFERAHPPVEGLTRDDAHAYFLRLNETAEIAFCEDLTVLVRAVGNGRGDFEICLSVEGGKLRIQEVLAGAANLVIELPLRVLGKIIRDDLSWDEAHIGYWCRLSRSPDVYHAGFWRLLQAPYYSRPAKPPPVNHGPISGNSVIADVIERYGEQGERILGRYGLYCSACQHSTSDTISLGARCHGVDDARTDRLVRELAALSGAENGGTSDKPGVRGEES